VLSVCRARVWMGENFGRGVFPLGMRIFWAMVQGLNLCTLRTRVWVGENFGRGVSPLGMRIFWAMVEGLNLCTLRTRVWVGENFVRGLSPLGMRIFWAMVEGLNLCASGLWALQERRYSVAFNTVICLVSAALRFFYMVRWFASVWGLCGGSKGCINERITCCDSM